MATITPTRPSDAAERRNFTPDRVRSALETLGFLPDGYGWPALHALMAGDSRVIVNLDDATRELLELAEIVNQLTDEYRQSVIKAIRALDGPAIKNLKSRQRRAVRDILNHLTGGTHLYQGVSLTAMELPSSRQVLDTLIAIVVIALPSLTA